MKLSKLGNYRNFNIKHYRKFTLMFISENPGIPSRTTRITMEQTLSLFVSYTLLVAFIGFLLFSLTPVKDLIFPSSGMSVNDKVMIKELNDRMIYLTRELEKIKVANQILKNSVQEPEINKVNKGGNILAVFREFVHKYYDSKEEITFINPAVGFISRGFMPENGHMGIDFVLKSGTAVYASASGYVLFSDYSSTGGYMVIILHPDGYISVYKHCSSLLKKEREKVIQGELIALSGNSGEITTGPHLHFEIWKNGKPIDPKSVLLTNKEDK